MSASTLSANFLGGGQLSSDKRFIDNWNEKFAAEFISRQDIAHSFEAKGLGNVELIEGDILETLDAYLTRRPELRIALLHVDTDVYAPAKFGLERLFPRVVRGGVIVFDDYATVEGETRAIEEFFEALPEYRLEKLTLSHTKPSFVVKR